MEASYEWTYQDYLAYCFATGQPILLATPTEESFMSQSIRTTTRQQLKSGAKAATKHVNKISKKIGQKASKIKKRTKKAVKSVYMTYQFVKHVGSDANWAIRMTNPDLPGELEQSYYEWIGHGARCDCDCWCGLGREGEW